MVEKCAVAPCRQRKIQLAARSQVPGGRSAAQPGHLQKRLLRMEKLKGIPPLVQIDRDFQRQSFPQVFPAIVILRYACGRVAHTEQQTHERHPLMRTHGKIDDIVTGETVPQGRRADHAVPPDAGDPRIIDKIHRSSLRMTTPRSSSQYSALPGLRDGVPMAPSPTSRQPSI